MIRLLIRSSFRRPYQWRQTPIWSDICLEAASGKLYITQFLLILVGLSMCTDSPIRSRMLKVQGTSIKQSTSESECLGDLAIIALKPGGSDIILLKLHSMNLILDKTASRSEFLEAYPPTLQLAILHNKAQKISIIKENQKEGVCPCCGYPSNNQPLTFFGNSTQQLHFLGPGAPLLFIFFKNVTILILVNTLISGIYSLITNSLGSYCTSGNNGCVQSQFTRMSIANVLDNPVLITLNSYINLLSVLISIIILHFSRYQSRKKTLQFDQGLLSPSDYSIIIKNIPPQTQLIQIQNELKEWHEFRSIKEPLKFKFVVPLGIEEFLGLKNKKTLLQKEYRKLELIKIKTGFYPDNYSQSQIGQLLNNISAINSNLKQLSNRTADRSRFVLARFNSAFMRARIQNDFKKGPFRPGNFLKRFLGQVYQIERAPQPDQILWQNATYSKVNKGFRTVFIYLLAAALVSLSFYISYLVNLQQIQINRTKGSGSTLLSVLLGLVLSVLNGLISFFFSKITYLQKPLTETEYVKSLTYKIAITQFLNTIGSLFLTNVIIVAQVNFYGNGGLIQEITTTLIVNTFLSTLVTLFFDVGFILSQVKMYLTKKQLEEKECYHTQGQVNQIFVGVKPDFCGIYSFVIKTVWLTGMFGLLIPIIWVLGLSSMLLSWLSQKYLYFYRYYRPKMISQALNQQMLQLLEYFPFLSSISNFIFFMYVYKFDFIKYPVLQLVPTIMSMILSLVNIFLPNNLINKRLFPFDNEQPIQTYEQAKQLFESDYQQCNPASQIAASKNVQKLIFNNFKKTAAEPLLEITTRPIKEQQLQLIVTQD